MTITARVVDDSDKGRLLYGAGIRSQWIAPYALLDPLLQLQDGPLPSTPGAGVRRWLSRRSLRRMRRLGGT